MLTHLMFMRHAKSSWDDPTLSDHERVLNARGRAAADTVGQALDARGYAPDLIWASDAERTKETAIRMMHVMPSSQTVVYGPQFYHAGAQDVLHACLQNGEPDCSRLMLLGHNPGWAALYEMYSGSFHSFPTAACAVFKRKAGGSDWLHPNSWAAIDLILPRELM